MTKGTKAPGEVNPGKTTFDSNGKPPAPKLVKPAVAKPPTRKATEAAQTAKAKAADAAK